MTSRPLHAVLLPAEAAGGRLLEALSAALDGSGPAILPLDPDLPRERLDALLGAFAPATIETPEGTTRLAPAGPGAAARPGVRPETAVVIATSGSTGPPKGTELSAAALLASARASLGRLGARPGDRWLCCLRASHVAGIGCSSARCWPGPPPVVSDRGSARDAGGQRLRVRLAGPDPAAPPARRGRRPVGAAGDTARRRRDAGGLLADASAAGARVITTYGMSETCGGCVYDGVPLDEVSVRGRRRRPDPDRRAGAVFRLPAAARPDRRARDGRWFITSDLGSISPSGRLRVRGRADDVIITGGEKVVAGEVAAVLGTCPGVREAVVVGRPDPEWGELVTAIVVPADPADPPTLGALRARVREKLPPRAAPRRLVLVARIPLLPSGKPDLERLRERATASRACRPDTGTI